ncbi:hypothetical protein PYCC9005_004021 [Savitreella phatthalungensis]
MGLLATLSPVGELAKSFGLPVTRRYSPPAIELQRPLWMVLALPVLYLGVLNSLRSRLTLPRTNGRRRVRGWSCIIFVIAFPFVWGSEASGSRVIDFGLAVIAFVLSLRIFRIAFLRDAEETAKWSATEYWGRLFTFVVEYDPETRSHTQGPSARAENAKDLAVSAVKMVFACVAIRCIPPPESFADMSWLQARAYYAILGVILLVCLEGFVGGFFAAYGFVNDRHMRHMFNRPLISSGFRDLWGRRWNLPVHDVLKNVVFNGLVFPLAKSFHRPDAVSKGTREHGQRTFRQNCSAALLTFLVSGAFHEVMSYIAFGDIRWANIRYFTWNAVGCSIEVYLETKAWPRYATIKHNWLFRAIFVLTWAYLSESYTEGYLMFGFFEEAKTWIGLIAPPLRVDEVVWLVGKPVRGNW